MRYFKYIGLLVCISMSWVIKAQDFKTDMIKVKQVYESLKHFECNYNIGVYFNDKLHSSVLMEAKFSDSNYIYHIGKEITAICNKNTMITADNDLKIIAVGHRQSFAMDVEDYLPDTEDSITYTTQSKKETNGWHTYTFNYSAGRLKSSTITLNPETGYITYMDYTNREPEEYAWRTFGTRKTVVKFENLKSIEPLPSQYFTVNKYVTKTAGGYKAAAAYSSYQVLDTTLKPE